MSKLHTYADKDEFETKYNEEKRGKRRTGYDHDRYDEQFDALRLILKERDKEIYRLRCRIIELENQKDKQ